MFVFIPFFFFLFFFFFFFSFLILDIYRCRQVDVGAASKQKLHRGQIAMQSRKVNGRAILTEWS